MCEVFAPHVAFGYPTKTSDKASGGPVATSVPNLADQPSRLERFKDILRLIGLALGPASLTNYLGTLILPHEFVVQYLVICSISAFIITLLILIKFPVRLLRQYVLPVAYVVLLFALALPLVRMLNWWKISEPVKWSRNLIGKTLKECASIASRSGVNDECVIDQLRTFDTNWPAVLPDDLRIGETLWSDPNIRRVLDRCYGIKQDFLGTGMSLPDNANGDYSRSRIPEYFIPNLSEENPSVWSWSIDPDDPKLGGALFDFITQTQPTRAHAGSPTLSEILVTHDSRLKPGESAPIVVRFGQFPGETTSLGHPGARLVFASHLGEMVSLHLTVAEAASYSGRSVVQSPEENKFHIWVVIPEANRVIFPATWHNLLRDIASKSAVVNATGCGS